MKTPFDIYMQVQEQEHPNKNNYTLPDEYELKAMEVYASQFKTNPIDAQSWTYMDDLKSAFEGGIEHEHRCLCGKCDYCIDIQSEDDGPDFEQWYFNKFGHFRQTTEVTNPIEVIKKKVELTESETLQLGIEIVAAMKASLCDWDIEQGRFMALEDTFELTEADIVGSTEIAHEHLPFHNEKVVPFERERLHKQAIFAANTVIDLLNNTRHT